MVRQAHIQPVQYRIGYIAGKLMGEPIAKAEILLYGSFLATGKGHGTRKALVAGLAWNEA